MINLIVSLLIGAVSWVLTALFFSFSVWAGVFPFFVFSIVALIVLNRRTAKKVQAVVRKAEEMMANLPKLPSEQARTILLNKTIDQLKEAYKYKNYQFFLAQNINAQIGTIYYLQNKLKDARPYLEHAFVQQGVAVAMYACILYRENDVTGMTAAFERTLKVNKKQPLIWNLYAWCLMQLKKRDESIAVLNRCLADNPGDAITKENLDLAKNSAKIKMRGYNEQWYQFRLEDPPMMKINPQFDKRAMFRGR